MRALQAQHPEMMSALSGGTEAPVQAALPGGGARARGGMEGPAAPQPAPDAQGTFVRGERKIGRNEPCPCGSGKKYKHCHGALSSVE